ncbi:MAG: hemin-degrading factor [Ignavibacteriae bacterium HGW-Ignavibacteriae-4]|jgi:putative hemin transport protein|nr:MAG: hemin-degrading factor [Ignavibacteriae bacterium HGW-Ignavibacteriae-4]
MPTTETPSLKERYEQVIQSNPKLRIKEYADLLGISELELLASSLHDPAVKLQETPIEIYKELPKLGRVMVLARNENAVHERKGIFGKVQVHGSMGLILGEDIDLRVFFDDWKYVYNVEKEHNGKMLRSIQFFNKYGKPAQKVYLTDDSNEEEYQKLIETFRSDDTTLPVVEKGEKPKNYNAIEDIDFDKAISEWEKLEDTHNFQTILDTQKIKRLELIKRAPDNLAYRVYNDAVIDILHSAVDRQVPIMVFVANDDIVQIHTGEIKNIRLIENWTNIMDENFNMHLRNDLIAETYVLFKPTNDGVVTSLELYDMEGELAITFFGKRKPGIPELPEWQAIIAELEKAK